MGRGGERVSGSSALIRLIPHMSRMVRRTSRCNATTRASSYAKTSSQRCATRQFAHSNKYYWDIFGQSNGMQKVLPCAQNLSHFANFNYQGKVLVLFVPFLPFVPFASDSGREAMRVEGRTWAHGRMG